MRARYIATAVVALAATVGVPLAQTSAASVHRMTPSMQSAMSDARSRRVRTQGFFRSVCRYSHTSNDDPILFPNEPGAAMEHDFFGNTSTNASSTYQTLRAANSTSCVAPADTAAYWVPALYQNGAKVTPRGATIYYRLAGRAPGSVRALPAGLQMIAGNEKATSPQPLSIISWDCGVDRATDRPFVPRSSEPPASCPSGSTLKLHIRFPDCWDGRSLAGGSQTNVAYSQRGTCPAGYPVAVPAITLNVNYPISTGGGLQLSMGPGMLGSTDTAHADFVNAWDQRVVERLTVTCVDANRKCGTVGRNNQPMGVHRR